jgi:hypothetical protein
MKKYNLFTIYVEFSHGTKIFGTFSLPESLFPIDTLFWKTLWESRWQLLRIRLKEV